MLAATPLMIRAGVADGYYRPRPRPRCSGGTIGKQALGIAGFSLTPEPEPEPLNPTPTSAYSSRSTQQPAKSPNYSPRNRQTYLSVKDSFTVKAAERKPSEAGSGRRYQGTRIVSETHGNAAVAWKVLVKGPTADDVASNIETLIAEFEGLLNQPDVFIEWVPVGASFSTYYEVRGPAKWQPTYQWAQFFGTRGMYCDLEVPVGPLARGARVVQDLGSFAAPCVVELPDPVGGTAPAAANITLAKVSGPIIRRSGCWRGGSGSLLRRPGTASVLG